MLMMTLANAESRRITELLAAFEEHEITTHEFSECLERLSSEALFVVANYSTGSEDMFPVSDRLRSQSRSAGSLPRHAGLFLLLIL